MSTLRVVLVLVTSLLFCTSQAATGLPEAGDSWLILERPGMRGPEIVTVVRNLPAPVVRARFRILLQIAWGYRSLPNGMPTEEEIARARELYSALDRIVGKAGLYAMSRTGDGGRTIYYYVQDATSHQDAIRQYFDAQPPISVKVTVSEEPDWDSVRKVLDAVK